MLAQYSAFSYLQIMAYNIFSDCVSVITDYSQYSLAHLAHVNFLQQTFIV